MKLLAIGTWDPRETNIPRCSLQSNSAPVSFGD
jgi:hypothetical protein